MRYLTVPEPFTLLDPTTGNPVSGAPPVDFAVVGRLLVLDRTVSEGLDTFEVNDLRRKLTRQKDGVIELSDREHECLVKAAKRAGKEGSAISPAAAMSGDDALRAVVDAPSKDPRPRPALPEAP